MTSLFVVTSRFVVAMSKCLVVASWGISCFGVEASSTSGNLVFSDAEKGELVNCRYGDSNNVF